MEVHAGLNARRNLSASIYSHLSGAILDGRPATARSASTLPKNALQHTPVAAWQGPRGCEGRLI